ncbi:MAG TPA: hypothetical protein VFL73_02455 [Solirubrobacteraceae bacterium]|nr:hypothetical protein [Solirubrobacteraceae bacterium]
MTAKEQLRQAIEDLSEAEAADVLTIIRRTDPPGEQATRILEGIDGAIDAIQRGLADAQAGRTTSLDAFSRATS